LFPEGPLTGTGLRHWPRFTAYRRLQWTTKDDPHRNICRYLPKEAVDKIAQNFTANHLSDSPEWKVG